jgi:hypothetical protein
MKQWYCHDKARPETKHNVSMEVRLCLISVLNEVPAGPGKKQSVGQTVIACSQWSPLPLGELTQEDWQLALAALAIHLGHHGPTMPVLSDVEFEPPPLSDQGVPQSEDPAVGMLLPG